IYENALAIDENGLTDYAADYGRRNMIRRKGSIDSMETKDGSTLGDVMKNKVSFETKAPKEFNNADKLAQQVQQMRKASPTSGSGVGGNGSKRSEEHTSELQSRFDLVCRLLLV